MASEILKDFELAVISRPHKLAMMYHGYITRVMAFTWLSLFLNVEAVWVPSFTVEPTNCVVQLGGTAEFYAEASSSGQEMISYRWLRDGASIEGGTSKLLVVTNVTFATQREGFQAVAIGAGGGRSTSMLARVVVPNSPPMVIGWPLEIKRHATAGTNILFATGTSGAQPMFYQWYDGANALHGERQATLMVSNNYSSGPFYAVVSNAFGVGTGIVSEVHVSYSMEILRKWETNSVGVIDLAEGPGGDFFSLRENLAQNQPPMPTISRHGTNLEPNWSFQILSTVRLSEIDADEEGNVYAWGQSAGSFSWGTNHIPLNTTTTQVFLGKVSAKGQGLWAVPFRDGTMSTAAGMVVGSNEIWTATATIAPAAAGSARRYVTLRRFNFDGAVQETMTITNTPAFTRYPNMTLRGFEAKSLRRLPDGSFTLAGQNRYYTNSNGITREYNVGAVVAHDLAGTIRWWKEYSSEDVYNEDGTIFGFITDAGGNTYISGRFGDIHSRAGAFLSKVGPDGTELWRERARTDYWQTVSGVYPWTLEFAPNGNIRMAGMARYLGQGGYFLGGDYLPELPFVHEFSTAGELLNTTYFVLRPGEQKETDPLDIMTRGGEVLVSGRVRTFQQARGFIVALGYTKEPVSTNGPAHVIFWEAVGGTIRPKFQAAGPVAFEWHRDGQIFPNDNFSYLSLSPAEVERPADYRLIVRALGGAITNGPISVGNARMVREPLGVEVHSPSGATFDVRSRGSFETAEAWGVLTNVTSFGVPMLIPFSAAGKSEFLQIITK